MSRKDTVNSLFLGKMGAPNPVVHDRPVERVRSGAISAMGASLQEMSETAQAGKALQEQIASGMIILEIDPSLIEASAISDRLIQPQDVDEDKMVESMRSFGQQVPALLRPHPKHPGRYQVAYGRRRLRAAQRLGVPLKAIIRDLSDSELVIAQGKENLDRKDLSFIEKALFALRLEEAGFDRHIIIAALATDKADLSRYLAIARAIPFELIVAIGPAIKVGRARWQLFSELLKTSPNSKSLDSLVSQDQFLSAKSDQRFNMALAVLSPKPIEKDNSLEDLNFATQGHAIVQAQKGQGKMTLIFDEERAPDFAQFVMKEMQQLYSLYEAQR